MKEIPMIYIKINQTGIVLFVAIAVILQQLLLLAVLWLIQLAGLLFGLKANVFIQLARPFVQERAMRGEKQAMEMQRFNNILGVVFLTVSLAGFALGWTIAGYIFAIMLFLAAFIAILGFCIGCVMYYQFKQLRHRMK